jgi:hypothetical protein
MAFLCTFKTRALIKKRDESLRCNMQIESQIVENGIILVQIATSTSDEARNRRMQRASGLVCLSKINFSDHRAVVVARRLCFAEH